MPPKKARSKKTADVAPLADEHTASQQDDISMTDAPAPTDTSAAEKLHDDFLQGFDGQRVRVLPGSSETAASFEFTGEDHTLGNALRYIIMKNPDVEFCGYSIPHPSEPKMNIRIQTYEGTTAHAALEKGFDDLIDLCDVVADKFATATAELKVGHMEMA